MENKPPYSLNRAEQFREFAKKQSYFQLILENCFDELCRKCEDVTLEIRLYFQRTEMYVYIYQDGSITYKDRDCSSLNTIEQAKQLILTLQNKEQCLVSIIDEFIVSIPLEFWTNHTYHTDKGVPTMAAPHVEKAKTKLRLERLLERCFAEFLESTSQTLIGLQTYDNELQICIYFSGECSVYISPRKEKVYHLLSAASVATLQTAYAAINQLEKMESKYGKTVYDFIQTIPAEYWEILESRPQ